jgi:hypothetical protein
MRVNLDSQISNRLKDSPQGSFSEFNPRIIMWTDPFQFFFYGRSYFEPIDKCMEGLFRDAFYKACLITSADPAKLEDFTRFKHANIAADKDGYLVLLAQSEWSLNTERINNPEIEFHFTSEIHK